MNNTYKLLCGLIIGTPMLFGCGGGEDAFSGTSGTSSSNIIAAKNFSIAADELNPEVLAFSTDPVSTANSDVCANKGVTIQNVTVEITAIAGDQDNAKVTSGTVYFETQFGLLSASSCTLDSTGTCSITWTSTANITPLYIDGDCSNGANTIDVLNNITAWTYGAETFTDANDDGVLSSGETYTDIDEPYLDNNDTGSYDAFNAANAINDKVIDALTPKNSAHDNGDNNYNGPNCDSTARSDCAGATLIPVYSTLRLRLNYLPSS
jgi:hypothetical protein